MTSQHHKSQARSRALQVILPAMSMCLQQVQVRTCTCLVPAPKQVFATGR